MKTDYKRLGVEDIGEILANALNGTSTKFYAGMLKHLEVEENEGHPGTFYIWTETKRKADADVFSALIRGAAAAHGCTCENNVTWGEALMAGGGRRHVEFYIADYGFGERYVA